MSSRKFISNLLIIALLISFLPLISENVSATLPTITNYGVLPTYGEIQSIIPYRFFLTYTDIDNQAPDAGYPKGYRYFGIAWPAFTFVANDTEDTNYADGKAYYFDYYNYPLIGTVMYRFDVKSNGETVIYKWPISMNAHLPTSPIPFHIFPVGNEPGEKIFTFNYTSGWGYTPVSVNVTIDGISHPMIANDTDDIEYRDGKDFYYEINITSGLHNYSFEWTETSYYFDEKTTGIYWFNIEEPTDYNKLIVAIVIISLLFFIALIIFVSKNKGGENHG